MRCIICHSTKLSDDRVPPSQPRRKNRPTSVSRRAGPNRPGGTHSRHPRLHRAPPKPVSHLGTVQLHQPDGQIDLEILLIAVEQHDTDSAAPAAAESPPWRRHLPSGHGLLIPRRQAESRFRQQAVWHGPYPEDPRYPDTGEDLSAVSRRIDASWLPSRRGQFWRSSASAADTTGAAAGAGHRGIAARIGRFSNGYRAPGYGNPNMK